MRQGNIEYKKGKLKKALEAYEKAKATERIEKIKRELKTESLYQKSLHISGFNGFCGSASSQPDGKTRSR